MLSNCESTTSQYYFMYGAGAGSGSTTRVQRNAGLVCHMCAVDHTSEGITVYILVLDAARPGHHTYKVCVQLKTGKAIFLKNRASERIVIKSYVANPDLMDKYS